MHDIYDLFDALLLVHSPIRNGKNVRNCLQENLFRSHCLSKKNITRSTRVTRGRSINSLKLGKKWSNSASHFFIVGFFISWVQKKTYHYWVAFSHPHIIAPIIWEVMGVWTAPIAQLVWEKPSVMILARKESGGGYNYHNR